MRKTIQLHSNMEMARPSMLKVLTVQNIPYMQTTCRCRMKDSLSTRIVLRNTLSALHNHDLTKRRMDRDLLLRPIHRSRRKDDCLGQMMSAHYKSDSACNLPKWPMSRLSSSSADRHWQNTRRIREGLDIVRDMNDMRDVVDRDERDGTPKMKMMKIETMERTTTIVVVVIIVATITAVDVFIKIVVFDIGLIDATLPPADMVHSAAEMMIVARTTTIIAQD